MVLAKELTTWDQVKAESTQLCQDKPKEYLKRLNFEFAEIEKQGASDYWLDLIKSGKDFDTNPHGLVLPFLLKLTTIDPIIHAKTYQLDPAGCVEDVMEITLDDGRIVEIPSKCLVMTPKGPKLISSLKIGDVLG